MRQAARPKTIEITAFETELGWMAIAGAGSALCALTFGQRRESDAFARLARDFTSLEEDSWNPQLEARLIAYAAGEEDDFRDVDVDYGDITPFGRKVLDACRRISYGSTSTYAKLANRAGRPGAARAVGNCMAANRMPLVVPCHRVVYAGGTIGAYSGADGPRTKRQLLQMERAAGLKLA